MRRVVISAVMLIIVLSALFVLSKGCSNSVIIRFGETAAIDSILSSFDEERAFKLLENQVKMGARVPGTSPHEKCASWLESHMRKYTNQVHTQRFEVKWKDSHFKLTNVIGVFVGKAGETLLIGTHWDCHPTADMEEDQSKRNEPVPGANDGASGTAILLEISRVLNMHTPPITIIIALFDGEDFGEWIYGSRHFVSNPIPYMPDASIIIDMVGDSDLNIARELNSLESSPKLWDAMMESVKALGYEKHFKGSHVRILDDHLPFIEAGKPAILLIDFDYKHWHTTRDTPDKCSARSLGTIGRVLLHFIFVTAKKWFSG